MSKIVYGVMLKDGTKQDFYSDKFYLTIEDAMEDLRKDGWRRISPFETFLYFDSDKMETRIVSSLEKPNLLGRHKDSKFVEIEEYTLFEPNKPGEE